MEHREYTWQASDGLHLHAQAWTPDRPADAVVCLVHGHGEHSSRYAGLAGALTAAGFALSAFDLRGHGYSEGVRGHSPTYTTLLDDIDLLLRDAAIRYPGVPCFLYGHSMGGALALNYVVNRQPALAGVVATAPLLRPAIRTPLWKLAAAYLMYALWPSFQFNSGVKRAMCTHEPASQHDPLNHAQLSARLGLEMLRAGEWALAHAADFPLPLLLMIGSADAVSSVDAVRAFATRAPQCTLTVFDGLLHELHNDAGHEAVSACLIDWLCATMPPRKEP